MSRLSPDLLARARRAARRGEFFRPAELLLALPVLQPADEPEPARLRVVSVLGMVLNDQPAPEFTGVLVLTPDYAYLELNGQYHEQPLSAATPIHLEYAGYQTADWQLSLRGTEAVAADTRLQVGSWPRLPVLVRHAQHEQLLIQLLQGWYEQRVPVHEVYAGQRTILLGLNRGYAETQALKQRYGIRLY
ncbi:hypothetical protein [Hymenobacter sp. B81]|uniref:hypothetical protein n=1 Tax=Hymenobacter sp. B81 TaxID=3344878 RepID=UPI0037DCA1E5